MIYNRNDETHPFFKTTAHERLVTERDRLRSLNVELLAALEAIANNRFSADVPDDELDEHNYAQGWDELVKIARAAIDKAKE